jgi:hypothetical protein
MSRIEQQQRQRTAINEDTIDDQYELAHRVMHACRMCLPGEPGRVAGEHGYHISDMREMPYERRGRRSKYAVGFVVSHDVRPETGAYRLESLGFITIAVLEDLTLTVLKKEGDVEEVIRCIEEA